MKIHEVRESRRLRPQKLSARETPHATIETNTTCNIRCRNCYCIDQPEMKPLAQVLDEIELTTRKRNLDAISLLGGEPTLHPDIVQIVEHVKARGLVCQLLTNGVRFLQGDHVLLDALVRAGVDRFLVHIDSGQAHVHADVDAAREALFTMLDARRVAFGLALTIYPGEERTLSDVLRRCAPHPWFDGILGTLAFDLDHAFDRAPNGADRGDMREVYRGLSEDLGVEPSSYIPSSVDDAEVCWLVYFYFVDARTGATFALSPELVRASKRVFRAVAGHHFFAETLPSERAAPSLGLTGVAETLLHPKRLGELARFVRGLHDRRSLRLHYVVVQQAPRFDAAADRVQICWQCPDAAIRHGRLTPVCIAGRLDPLGGKPATAPREVAQAVYSHLGEPTG